MTLDNIQSQVGIGTKQIERYSEYGVPADPHIFYTYEPPSSTHGLGHAPITKHSHGGGFKSNASMSALTLLAFLFFLHILQQCIKENMIDPNTSPVMVMSAGKEAEIELGKGLIKIDKNGRDENNKHEEYKYEKSDNGQNIQMHGERNPHEQVDDENHLTKVNVAEYSPKIDKQKYQYVYKSYANRSSVFPGFVTAEEDNL